MAQHLQKRPAQVPKPFKLATIRTAWEKLPFPAKKNSSLRPSRNQRLGGDGLQDLLQVVAADAVLLPAQGPQHRNQVPSARGHPLQHDGHVPGPVVAQDLNEYMT